MERPTIWGINHLKFAVLDITKTRDFYCNLLGIEYLPQYDHHNLQRHLIAIMIRLKHTEATAMLIELRHDESQALAHHVQDPVTYAVRSKALLEEWKEWFEHNGVQCSRVHAHQSLKGKVPSASDPDGRVVVIYSDEKHETSDFDVGDF